MKQNVKIFLIALVIGMASAFLICYKFDPAIISNAIESKITYFCVGSYNNIEEATRKQKNYANSLIYKENEIYKIIIGVYHKKESIELMESYFLDKGITFRKSELKVTSDMIKTMQNYELLITSSDKSYYENINNSLLKQFNEYINK